MEENKTQDFTKSATKALEGLTLFFNSVNEIAFYDNPEQWQQDQELLNSDRFNEFRETSAKIKELIEEAQQDERRDIKCIRDDFLQLVGIERINEPMNFEETEKKINELQNQISETKQQALLEKREGNLNKALLSMKRLKSLQQQLDRYNLLKQEFLKQSNL